MTLKAKIQNITRKRDVGRHSEEEALYQSKLAERRRDDPSFKPMTGLDIMNGGPDATSIIAAVHVPGATGHIGGTVAELIVDRLAAHGFKIVRS